MAMKFGIFNLMNEYGFTQRDVFEGTIACVKLVEEIGFDVAWFAEHHFSNYSLCPSPLMMAAAVSRETSRIGLGPAVVVAPLYNPIRLSEELALLDQLSHGRAILGIGSGYQRFEFDAFGADLAERQERMLEVWRIVNQAVHSNLFGTHGRMYRMPNVPQAIRLYSPRRIDSCFV
jgi:alkanesulfonate monooxygenase SsuD/methylene tetrahydromethanopterin reductase-like flavin-dependent oxidoreductase (luciferase family)